MANFRFVWRSLGRNPGFAATAIASLALGIGAGAAIFTLADQMLMRLLPVKDAGRLVLFNRTGPFIGGTSRGGEDTFAYPVYTELRDGNPGVFTGIAARFQETADIADSGPAQRAAVELVSGNFFETLGVGAAIGRTLTPEDDRVKNGAPVLVLSYAYWQRRFAGDPGVLNRKVELNGRPMTVVGVAQRGFLGFETLSPSDVFVPMTMKPVVTPSWDDLERRDSIWLKIFGRLKPGVTPEAASGALQPAYTRALENDLAAVNRVAEFRKQYLANTIRLEIASRGFAGAREFLSRPILILMALTGLLLLIACLNVANLLITRSAARRKEIAIRVSMGATRGSLIGLLLSESLILAVAGGLVGIIVAPWVSSALVAMLPWQQMALGIDTTPSLRVLAFAAALTMLATIFAGLAPAIQASRLDAQPALRTETSRLSLGRGQARLRKLLVSAQVTLSLVMLAGAGLFSRSLLKLFSVETGADTGRLLTFTIDPSLHKYETARALALFSDAQRDLRRSPGVVSASGASFAILAGPKWENTLAVEGYQRRPNEDMQAGWNQVMPGFFSTLGVPLLAGREFDERDAGEKRTVVIVNETLAKRFFPGENAVGRHIAFGGGPPWLEIVGVVRDWKNNALDERSKPWTYTPALQDSRPAAMTFYLRSGGDPKTAIQTARQVVGRLDPALPVFDIKAVEAQIDETHFVQRMFAMLSGAFASMATLLCCIGLFGMTAYSVARRTHEIGIRIALGASGMNILRLVMREVVVVTAAGVVAGIPLVLALGRLIESQLFGVKGSDPVVVAAATAAVCLTSALAGYLPARMATRIDPLDALHYD